MPTVRTRFAPSPTGYMHIGGMRTALFNWLFARHHGGRFILRIDDTDLKRNVEEALAPILRAFRWLDLDWDEGPEVGGEHGPYFQSQRFDLYQHAADRLLAEGKAYRDFRPPEQVQAERRAAEQEKRTYLARPESLIPGDDGVLECPGEAAEPVVRFLIPREGSIALDDGVRGKVEWDASLIPDPVILRGNGSPLYNFATVVDDASMHVTHVIRAEEHLSNTPIQILLHQAFGHELPQFAHIPYVAAPGSKEKLSKRDNKLEKYRKNPQFKKMFDAADRVFPRIGLGSSETLNPVMVAYYEQIGYLPEAVFNALARLGWSYDDKTEIMSREFVVEHFSLDRVIKSPAGFDPDKLLSYQAHWMGHLSLDEKVAGCIPYLVDAGLVQKSEVRDQESGADKAHGWQSVGSPVDVGSETYGYLRRVVTALGDRLKLFSDVLEFDYFFLPDDQFPYDENAFHKRLRNAPESVELLKKLRDRLAGLEPFTAQTTEQALQQFVEAEGIKIGQIIHALRAAVTGQSTGPGMFDCLDLLGKARTLTRIDRALMLADSSQ